MKNSLMAILIVCFVFSQTPSSSRHPTNLEDQSALTSPVSDQIEPGAGNWRAWIISSGRDYRVSPPPNPAETSAELRSLADVISQIANADVVTDWNTIAVSTVSADTLPNRQSRDVAMVHAAMFDAMNAIRPYYTPAMVSITAKGYASREAAAAQAAHDVLLALFPARQPDLDAMLAASLAQIPPDDEHGHQPKYEGIVTGQAAAAAVLNARQNDHAFDRVSFIPLSGPGEYQFTPGCSSTNISAPGWGNVTPFTVSDPDYFPTATRPAVDDSEWLAALDEVRAYGASNSTVRTAEQTQIGLFYIEGSMTLVNRLARQLVSKEPVETDRAAASKQLLAHARLFAALNIAQADTYIRTWRSSIASTSGVHTPRSTSSTRGRTGRRSARRRAIPSSTPGMAR